MFSQGMSRRGGEIAGVVPLSLMVYDNFELDTSWRFC